jgi:hypothetical protein
MEIEQDEVGVDSTGRFDGLITIPRGVELGVSGSVQRGAGQAYVGLFVIDDEDARRGVARRRAALP